MIGMRYSKQGNSTKSMKILFAKQKIGIEILIIKIQIINWLLDCNFNPFADGISRWKSYIGAVSS